MISQSVTILTSTWSVAGPGGVNPSGEGLGMGGGAPE